MERNLRDIEIKQMIYDIYLNSKHTDSIIKALIERKILPKAVRYISHYQMKTWAAGLLHRDMTELSLCNQPTPYLSGPVSVTHIRSAEYEMELFIFGDNHKLSGECYDYANARELYGKHIHIENLIQWCAIINNNKRRDNIPVNLFIELVKSPSERELYMKSINKNTPPYYSTDPTLKNYPPLPLVRVAKLANIIKDIARVVPVENRQYMNYFEASIQKYDTETQLKLYNKYINDTIYKHFHTQFHILRNRYGNNFSEKMDYAVRYIIHIRVDQFKKTIREHIPNQPIDINRIAIVSLDSIFIEINILILLFKPYNYKFRSVRNTSARIVSDATPKRCILYLGNAHAYEILHALEIAFKFKRIFRQINLNDDPFQCLNITGLKQPLF